MCCDIIQTSENVKGILHTEEPAMKHDFGLISNLCKACRKQDRLSAIRHPLRCAFEAGFRPCFSGYLFSSHLLPSAWTSPQQ